MSKTSKNNWDAAIADAQRMIQEAQARIRALKKSIAMFRQLRDCGEPFPGEKAGQKKDLEK